jgi:hypothetical protein
MSRRRTDLLVSQGVDGCHQDIDIAAARFERSQRERAVEIHSKEFFTDKRSHF